LRGRDNDQRNGAVLSDLCAKLYETTFSTAGAPHPAKPARLCTIVPAKDSYADQYSCTSLAAPVKWRQAKVNAGFAAFAALDMRLT
jgi:hypothetical protein